MVTVAAASPVHVPPPPLGVMVHVTLPESISVAARKDDEIVADMVTVVPTSAPVATRVVAAGLIVTSSEVEVAWLA